ncbi:hypothetical protein N7540_001746 [Penicillium herquei]|nr:hypothetical protein N7540_001746 [Penicillium herquei]
MTTNSNPSNYGPLTTTFTPAPDCFAEKWVSHDDSSSLEAVLSWGAACSTSGSASIAHITAADSCYPEGYINVWRTRSVNPGTINEVFSPGYICPSGWEAVYTSTYGSAIPTTAYGARDVLIGANYVTLVANDILTACCPSGYALGSDFGPDACESYIWSLDARTSLGVISSDNQCVTTSIGNFSGTVGTYTLGSATAKASIIFLLHNTGSSSNNSVSPGLSTGAKIAIGVCVPAGILILAAVCFILWHRRRKSKPTGELPARRVPELRESGLHSELDSIARTVPGSTRAPLEISGSQRFEAGGTQRLELPGDSVQACK